MIKFHEYKKYYNNKLILNIEDKYLKEGIYWIKGENGTGKSTLLKSIAGLIPFEGDITVHGLKNNHTNNRAYRQIVNYGQAEPEYPSFLNGSDLIELYKNVKNASTEQVACLLNRFGIKEFHSERIGTYSSGMVKKLSLALAFIGKPKLILLDEPLITLDQHTTTLMIDLMQEHAKMGISIILVSHQEIPESMYFPMNVLSLQDQRLVSLS